MDSDGYTQSIANSEICGICFQQKD